MLMIKGIYGREIYETWYRMTVMLESGLDISPVITHRFNWQEHEKGFEAMRSGGSGKVILDWQDAKLGRVWQICDGVLLAPTIIHYVDQRT